MTNLSIHDLHLLIEAGKAPVLIDVREPHEHEEFNIGGINIPVTEMPFRIAELKALGDADFVLYCQSGSRSSLAQKLLDTQFNIHNTINLVGGLNAWKEAFGQ
jgi:rhodanese-related sulfurtransferase